MAFVVILVIEASEVVHMREKSDFSTFFRSLLKSKRKNVEKLHIGACTANFFLWWLSLRRRRG